MKNIEQLKKYNRFYNFLFQLSPGFLHKGLAKVLWSFSDKEKIQTFQKRQIQYENLQWRVFFTKLYLAIVGKNNAKRASRDSRASSQNRINLDPITLQKLTTFVAPANVTDFLDYLDDYPIPIDVDAISLTGEHANRVIAIYELGEPVVKKIRMGKTLLPYIEYDKIMRGLSSLAIPEIKQKATTDL